MGDFYREDKLANIGYALHGSVWLMALPSELTFDFFRDRCGLPN